MVLAFGANDTNLTVRARPADVVAAYDEVWDAFGRLGIETFVATTPPRYGSRDGAIGQLNRLLRKRFPASRLIDFDTTVEAADLTDGLHIGDAGQHKRARAAYRTLTGQADA